MGYTPLFDTITRGTLCGRWPDIGLWPIVLSLADRHGVVDSTPAHIAAVTGLPLEDVTACLKRFCAPDPDSRSQDHDGARLVLLDVSRDWGWLVVNHSRYREKARKLTYDSKRTASGLDAERKRLSRDVPTRPASSRSQTETETETKREEKREKARKARLPAEWSPSEELRAWTQTSHPDVNAHTELEKFRDHWTSKGEARLDWDATWRNWIRKAAQFSNAAKPFSERKTTWRPDPADDEPLEKHA